MGEELDPILFDDALSAGQRAVFRKALDADPELAAAYGRWQAVRSAIRESLAAHVPDRHVLVLYALDTPEHAHALSHAEREALSHFRPTLDAAMQSHPALEDVVRRIREDAEIFDRTWRDHVSVPNLPRRASDRSPMRLVARQPIRTWAWRVAAVFAVTVFAVVLNHLMQRDSGSVTFAAASGEVRHIELADGSSVRLLGGSSLAYDGRDDAFDRHVRLTGRAFFDIVKDGKSFTVETPTAWTTVLGTTFGVQADEAATEVVLVNGRVSLAPRPDLEHAVFLQPGEMSRVEGHAPPTAPTSVDVSAALDWPGLFVFRATPLDDAIARLSRHFGAHVTLGTGLAADSVSGTFGQDESLEGILRTLAVTLSAEVEKTDDGGYVIHPHSAR